MSNIFHKVCPQCASTLALAVVTCGCGYSFESSDSERSQPTLEQIAEEQQLYEEYLRARVQQAIEAACGAADAAAMDPGNTLKAAEALQSVDFAETAKGKLVAQVARAVRSTQLAARGDMKRVTKPVRPFASKVVAT